MRIAVQWFFFFLSLLQAINYNFNLKWNLESFFGLYYKTCAAILVGRVPTTTTTTRFMVKRVIVSLHVFAQNTK